MSLDRFISTPPEEILQQYTREVNHAMECGGSVFDYLDKIRSFPKPIVVDFNNVLASNVSPVVPNPKGVQFLTELRKTGTVFIVTCAENWQMVKEGLEVGNMWSERDVLLVEGNWCFLEEYGAPGRIIPKAQEAIVEYLNLIGRFTSDDFNRPSGFKRVAPLFLRPFDVPIVDDFHGAHTGNPGMLGFAVEIYEPTDKTIVEIVNARPERISLETAATQIEYYYQEIGLK